MTQYRLPDKMHPASLQLVVAVSPDMRPGFFLAGPDTWRVLNQREGIARMKHELGITSQGIADRLKVRKRTVEGWIQGRPLRGSTIAEINRILRRHYGEAYVGARPDIILR